MIGHQILNYRILQKIGEGGMGSVYLAQHTQLDRKAAIKSLHPNLVSNPQIRARFKNEASTMARLRHPNIVSLYDYLESPQGLFLIMEYVEGLSLDQLILSVTGPMSESQIKSVFSKILSGFQYAHQQGVIHRDIKPSNLIIHPKTGEVKILDFGIAKLLDASDKQLTKAGARMGTVLYMSPEQVQGQNLDSRSDIYSLGVTLFQMLTGKNPYDEQNATEYEVYHKIVNQALPPAIDLYPNASPRIQELIHKATAKDPNQRFQTCQEFQQALEGGTSSLSSSNPYLSNYDPPLEEELEASTSPFRSLWLWLTVAFLSLSLLSFVVFINPFKLEVLKPWEIFTSQSEGEVSEVSSEEQNKAKEWLKEFYETVESHDFQALKPFYQDQVENYFGNLDRRLDPDLKSAYKIYWDTYIRERHDIDWTSLQIEAGEEGSLTLRFKMDYYFKTAGEDWKKLKINTLIQIDSEYKIFVIDKV